MPTVVGRAIQVFGIYSTNRWDDVPGPLLKRTNRQVIPTPRCQDQLLFLKIERAALAHGQVTALHVGNRK